MDWRTIKIIILESDIVQFTSYVRKQTPVVHALNDENSLSDLSMKI